MRLMITVVAERDGDSLPGSDDATVLKSIEVVLPYIDPKFITLPKIVDGVVLDVLTEHSEKIAAVVARQEARKMANPGPLWMSAVLTTNGEDGSDSDDA